MIIFLLLRDNKKILTSHSILDDVQNRNLVLREKEFYVKIKSLA